MLTRARLEAELRCHPALSLFDASGRPVLSPKAGVHFLRRDAAGGEKPSVTKVVLLD